MKIRQVEHEHDPEYFCKFIDNSYAATVRAEDSEEAAQEFVKEYDEQEPGDITTTSKVIVKGPDGKEEKFTVSGEYTTLYTAFSDEDDSDNDEANSGGEA
jgi:mRNA deadenylase 3'-5' endonuclease subunit Ccr4